MRKKLKEFFGRLTILFGLRGLARQSGFAQVQNIIPTKHHRHEILHAK